MQLKLDTIMLFVSDAESMKHFYHQVLGFTIIEEITDEWVLLSAGTAKIGLHKIGDTYTTDVSKKSSVESNSKIVFETDEDIDQLHAILLSKGVSVKHITSYDHYPYLLFMGQDPEGNIFQVIQKKK